jgi:hypothetical protein
MNAPVNAEETGAASLDALADRIALALVRGPKSHLALAEMVGANVNDVNAVVVGQPDRFCKIRVVRGRLRQRETLCLLAQSDNGSEP